MQPSVKALSSRHNLVIILVAYVLIIAVPQAFVSGPLRVAVLGLLLYVSVRGRRHARRWTWVAIVLSGLLLVATLVAAINGNEKAVSAVASGATAILTAAVIAIVARALVASRVIDGPTVRAVLSVYLLLALLFASVLQCLGVFISPFLHGASDPPTASQTLYFSVVTMATVGYGDITPVSSVARGIVVAEALTGQLYLVSVVAAVISRYRPEQQH